MAKRSSRAIRRDELMDAAIEVVGEAGIAGATVAAITGRAGLSVGLANHYFAGKDELLEYAMRRLAARFRRDILDALPADPGPAGRLLAIIDGSFAPRHFRAAERRAWMEFMLAAQSAPRIRHLYDVTGARFEANLRHAVRALAPPAEVDDIVHGLAALIDGFFWQIAGDYDEAMFEMARRIVRRHALLLMPSLADG